MKPHSSVGGFRLFIRRVTPLACRLHTHLMEQIVSPTVSSHHNVVAGKESRRRLSTIETLMLDIKNSVAELTESYLLPEFVVPHPKSENWSQIVEPIYWAKMLLTEHLESSIFGFRHAGNGIPLHNHVNMYAFMRVLRGRVLIASFSLLHDNEWTKEILTVNEKCMPAIYQGVRELSASNPDVAILGPKENNLHMVMAMEDGTAFIDFFVPGYKNNDYEDVMSKLRVGDRYWLYSTGEPKDFHMQTIGPNI